MTDSKQYSHDVELPGVTMEMVRLAFWRTLLNDEAIGRNETIHRSYVREKAELLYEAKEWWVIRQALHPALWSRFYVQLGVLLGQSRPAEDVLFAFGHALNEIRARDSAALYEDLTIIEERMNAR